MNKDLGTVLKELRKKANLTAKDVSTKLRNSGYEISDKTISGYETGIRMPNADVFMALCQIYNCKNILEIFSFVKADYSVPNDDEWKLIEKYRSLDSFGQETVSYILDRESARMEQLQQKDTQIKEQSCRIIGLETEKPTLLHMYTYLHKIACAGKGFYFEDIPVDTMAAPYVDGADFIISVNGDSMEPTYHDGDLVYVQKSQIVNIGDIGIFILNGECYIKEAGEKGLISHNPKYDLIPGNENIICIGRVLERVPEEYTA